MVRFRKNFFCDNINSYLFDRIVYLVLAVVILGGYSVLALHVGSQKGGIVGYK